MCLSIISTIGSGRGRGEIIGSSNDLFLGNLQITSNLLIDEIVQLTVGQFAKEIVEEKEKWKGNTLIHFPSSIGHQQMKGPYIIIIQTTNQSVIVK